MTTSTSKPKSKQSNGVSPGSPTPLAGMSARAPARTPRKKPRSGSARQLEALDDDPWELHPTFDLVVSESGGYALNTFFFEQLFADAERLRAKIGPWVDGIAQQLPMTAAHRDFLTTACRDRPRLRRRLRSIVHRGHITRVSVNDVKRHVREMELPARNFVQQNKLVVDDDNVEELLRILNEDLTRGGLTHDPFWIEGKEPMKSHQSTRVSAHQGDERRRTRSPSR